MKIYKLRKLTLVAGTLILTLLLEKSSIEPVAFESKKVIGFNLETPQERFYSIYNEGLKLKDERKKAEFEKLRIEQELLEKEQLRIENVSCNLNNILEPSYLTVDELISMSILSQ